MPDAGLHVMHLAIGGNVGAEAMRRFGLPVLPLIVAVILGPTIESKLTESLAISQGDVSTLWGEPVAVAVYLVMAVMLVAMVLGALRRSVAPATPDSSTTDERELVDR